MYCGLLGPSPEHLFILSSKHNNTPHTKMSGLPINPKKRMQSGTTKLPKTAKKPRLEVQQTLYLANLCDKVNRKLLKHTLYILFSTYGEVYDINMKMKGQAHVILDSELAASYAMKALNDTVICGKKMTIEYAKKKSFVIEQAQKSLAEEENDG